MATQLMTTLVEAKNQSELNYVTNRQTRYKLIVTSEMALTETGRQRTNVSPAVFLIPRNQGHA